MVVSQEPAALPAAAEARERGSAEAGRVMAILRSTVALLLAAGYANLQARQFLTVQTASPMGEAAVTAAQKGLATAFSVGSLLEFAVSPYFGKLSDRYGRKPLLLSFLVAPAIMRALCVLVKQPAARLRLLQLDFISVRFLGVQPTQAVVGTMISDVVPAHAQPQARSHILAAVSLGQFVGNYAGGWWNAKRGAESTYALIAVIPAALLVVLSGLLPETRPGLRGAERARELPPAAEDPGRVEGGGAPLDPVPVQPRPSAAGLVLRDPECCLTAAILGLYEFMAQPGLGTVSIMFMQDRLGWGALAAGKFSSAVGLAIFLGSSLAGRIMKVLGSARHVTLAHCCTSLAFALWGTAAGARGMAGCLLPLALGTGASPVIMTRFMQRAEALGAGRGEAMAVVTALGAAARTLAPQIFIELYVRAKSGGERGRLSLGSPMLFLSGLALLQEVLHQALQLLRGGRTAGA